MSSGMDDAYKMECRDRERKALQRKYATGSAKREVVKMIGKAKVRLVAAMEVLNALDEKVAVDHHKRAFDEEADGLEHVIRMLDRMEKDVENMGVDLKEVTKTHKHHYATDDVDEGCTHCGVRRREGPIRV